MASGPGTPADAPTPPPRRRSPRRSPPPSEDVDASVTAPVPASDTTLGVDAAWTAIADGNANDTSLDSSVLRVALSAEDTAGRMTAVGEISLVAGSAVDVETGSTNSGVSGGSSLTPTSNPLTQEPAHPLAGESNLSPGGQAISEHGRNFPPLVSTQTQPRRPINTAQGAFPLTTLGPPLCGCCSCIIRYGPADCVGKQICCQRQCSEG